MVRNKIVDVCMHSPVVTKCAEYDCSCCVALHALTLLLCSTKAVA